MLTKRLCVIGTIVMAVSISAVGCGGSSGPSEEKAKVTLGEWASSLSSGDGKKFCELSGSAVQSQVESVGAAAYAHEGDTTSSSPTCEETASALKSVLVPASLSLLDKMAADAKTYSVSISGNTGSVTIPDTTSPTRLLWNQDHWTVDSSPLIDELAAQAQSGSG